MHYVHTHRDMGLIAIDQSLENGEGCVCPTWSWTILEILVLAALIAFLACKREEKVGQASTDGKVKG